MTGLDAGAQTVHRGDRRMVAGARSGQLTHQEIRQINMMKRDLQRDWMRARADGVVTYRERAMLERKQKQLDRMIFLQKNDRDRRRF